MKNTFLIILSLFLLTGCEKEIDIDLDDQSGKIVIEGNITDQPGPYVVKITKSVAFNHNNQYPTVTDARVVLSDNTGQIQTLKYAGKGEYKTTTFKGVAGRIYTLRIQAEGKQYTAQSTMPEAVSFINLKQDAFTIGGETNYIFLPVFTDPPELGNRYLFSMTVNHKTKKTFQVFSDNINNGLPNQRPLLLPNDDDNQVIEGDTIHVEMNCIDEKVFTYYNALVQIYDNGGPGGGVTPANPPSNISNGALGYFSAHTVRKRKTIIKTHSSLQ